MKKNVSQGKVKASSSAPTKMGPKVVPTAAPKSTNTANNTVVRTAKPNKR